MSTSGLAPDGQDGIIIMFLKTKIGLLAFAAAVIISLPAQSLAFYRVNLRNGQTIDAESYTFEKNMIVLKFKVGSVSFPIHLVDSITDAAGKAAPLSEPAREKPAEAKTPPAPAAPQVRPYVPPPAQVAPPPTQARPPAQARPQPPNPQDITMEEETAPEDEEMLDEEEEPLLGDEELLEEEPPPDEEQQ